jgi:hypothetical protein
VEIGSLKGCFKFAFSFKDYVYIPLISKSLGYRKLLLNGVIDRAYYNLEQACIHSFGVKLSFTKNFITARYSILSILRDTNIPASDSYIKHST